MPGLLFILCNGSSAAQICSELSWKLRFVSILLKKSIFIYYYFPHIAYEETGETKKLGQGKTASKQENQESDPGSLVLDSMLNKYLNKIKGILVSSNDKFIKVPLEKPIKFFLISLKALW